MPWSLASKKSGGCSGMRVNLAEVISRPLESGMAFKGLRPDVEQRNESLIEWTGLVSRKECQKKVYRCLLKLK